MILGVGTDMASIARIASVLDVQGDRFIMRCYAAEEKKHVEKTPALRANGYAKRWAAKEATAKALGLGIREGIYLKDIVVINDDNGRPHLQLRAGAAARLAEITPPGMRAELQLSLSDEGNLALAFVVISAVSQ